jgi:hypothetical protein
MHRKPNRKCSYFTTAEDDDGGVCSCSAFWKCKRKRKRKPALPDSKCGQHPTPQENASMPSPSPSQCSSQRARPMPLPLSAVHDDDKERVFDPPSAHAKHPTQHQHAQCLESEATALSSEDEDAITHFFARHHVSAIPALSIVHRKKPRRSGRPRITADALKEAPTHRGREQDQRSLQPRSKTRKRSKKKVRRGATNTTSTFVSSVVGAGSTELLEAVNGEQRVLVEYELPAGEERLDWDTDLVRRMVGEIE